MGLQKEAKLVIGIPMLTSPRSLRFWLQLCSASGQSGAAELLQTFAECEARGKEYMQTYCCDFMSHLISKVGVHTSTALQEHSLYGIYCGLQYQQATPMLMSRSRVDFAGAGHARHCWAARDASVRRGAAAHSPPHAARELVTHCLLMSMTVLIPSTYGSSVGGSAHGAAMRNGC